MTMLGAFELNQIYTGDARELARGIPDESVDMIVCDPPYLREYLWFYDWLGVEAMRVLKPGGYCFAYAACEHIPLRVSGMLSGGLDYFWIDALLHHGGYPRVTAQARALTVMEHTEYA